MAKGDGSLQGYYQKASSQEGSIRVVFLCFKISLAD